MSSGDECFEFRGDLPEGAPLRVDPSVVHHLERGGCKRADSSPAGLVSWQPNCYFAAVRRLVGDGHVTCPTQAAIWP